MTNLFTTGDFRSHSGLDLAWKIDCDALTDDDLATLAKLVADRIPFSRAVGVPRGGLRFAAALAMYASPNYNYLNPHKWRTLIVDDVLTTGASMARAYDEAKQSAVYVNGVVIFARGVRPHWVQPIFHLAPWMQP